MGIVLQIFQREELSKLMGNKNGQVYKTMFMIASIIFRYIEESLYILFTFLIDFLSKPWWRVIEWRELSQKSRKLVDVCFSKCDTLKFWVYHPRLKAFFLRLLGIHHFQRYTCANILWDLIIVRTRGGVESTKMILWKFRSNLSREGLCHNLWERSGSWRQGSWLVLRTTRHSYVVLSTPVQDGPGTFW